MASHNHKRKLDEPVQHPAFGMPRPKKRKDTGTFPRQNALHPAVPTLKSPEVIKIKDESEDDNLADINPLIKTACTNGRDDFISLRAAVSYHGEEIDQNRRISESLRDQITDWSFRTQRLEAVITKLNNTVNDTTALDAFKESVVDMITNDTRNERRIADLSQRLEQLENHHANQERTPAPKHFARNASVQDAPSFDKSNSTSTCNHGKLSATKSTSEAKMPLVSTAGSSLPERKSSTNITSTAGTATLSLSFAIPSTISHLGLSPADWAVAAAAATPPPLSNAGLEKLLRAVDFSDPAHLRALAELDSRDHPRDSILFCDSHTFHMFRVDYMVVGGRTTSYIADHPSCGREGRAARLGLERRGLGRLRALELSVRPLRRARGGSGGGRGGSGGVGGGGGNSEDEDEDEAAIRAWRERVAPPAFVYELGQLFLRRKGQDRFDVHPTQYNVVVDMTRRAKAVWLVMRPEYVPVAKAYKEKDSSVPFQTNMFSLNGVAVGRVAARLADLSLTHPPFAFESHRAFYDAQAEVGNTAYKGKVRLQFRTPDLVDMMRTITAGWGGGDHEVMKE
ncbi:hypothetical protein F5X99DRAFT_432954 [Biscogniauxia marginata]|nr:hypothetical protein F5X99DRAFT_432954 [Biscogniauxia marginata]